MNSPKRRVIIAVDGLAASGKSTLARSLAGKLGFACLSSGVLYRILAWGAWHGKIIPSEQVQLERFLSGISLEAILDSQKQVRFKLNGKPVGEEIYSKDVSEFASKLAALPRVREFLLPIQRGLFPETSMVVEGRDIGTVVFPQADLKFFVTADIGLRAERRLAQRGTGAGKGLKLEIERELLERDRRDTERALSPTVQAPDAVLIDNSADTLTFVVESMYHHVLQRGLIILKN